MLTLWKCVPFFKNIYRAIKTTRIHSEFFPKCWSNKKKIIMKSFLVAALLLVIFQRKLFLNFYLIKINLITIIFFIHWILLSLDDAYAANEAVYITNTDEVQLIRDAKVNIQPPANMKKGKYLVLAVNEDRIKILYPVNRGLCTLFIWNFFYRKIAWILSQIQKNIKQFFSSLNEKFEMTKFILQACMLPSSWYFSTMPKPLWNKVVFH